MLDTTLHIKIFLEVFDYHAPWKQKKVQGNQAHFMTNEIRKDIYNGMLKPKTIC